MATFGELVAWCTEQLRGVFGLDVDEKLIQYILSIENEEEIREYVADLVQGTDGRKKHFVDELVTRWQRSCEPATSDLLPLCRKKDDTLEAPRSGDQAKRGRRKGRNKQEAPVHVETDPPMEEVKTPLDLAKAQEMDGGGGAFSKKKVRFVNLYTKEGQDKLAVMLPGRHPCECLAQKHRLINNCLTCGRIVCEQEGSGPCLFCGTLVCTKEEQDILQRDSNKSQKLLKKLLGGAENSGKVEVGGKDLLPHHEARLKAGLEMATKHKDKLLEYDRTSVRRTQVIDDESDYFATDSNQWLSKQEREALKKREKELQELRHASRLSKKVTIDFAGRQVLEEQDDLAEYHSRRSPPRQSPSPQGRRTPSASSPLPPTTRYRSRSPSRRRRSSLRHDNILSPRSQSPSEVDHPPPPAPILTASRPSSSSLEEDARRPSQSTSRGREKTTLGLRGLGPCWYPFPMMVPWDSGDWPSFPVWSPAVGPWSHKQHSVWGPVAHVGDSASHELESDVSPDFGSENYSDAPSPDDMVGDLSPPSPTEDFRSSSAQTIRMAQAFELDYQRIDPQTSDPLLKVLFTPGSGPVALPFLRGLQEVALQAWRKPASGPASSESIENFYRVMDEDSAYLFRHPKANPTLSAVLPTWSWSRSAPLDKEGRRLDRLGRRVYTSGAVGLRVTNFTAVMGRYQIHLWEKMRQFVDALPDDKKPLADALITEGFELGMRQLDASRHSADCHSRAMGSGIVLRRHSWLRSSTLPRHARAKIEDLPFEGKELFSAQTDKVLERVRKYKLTPKSLGITSGGIQSTRQRYWQHAFYRYPAYRYFGYPGARYRLPPADAQGLRSPFTQPPALRRQSRKRPRNQN